MTNDPSSSAERREPSGYRSAPRHLHLLEAPPDAIRRYRGAWFAAWCLAAFVTAAYLLLLAAGLDSRHRQPGYPLAPCVMFGVLAPLAGWYGGRAALRSVQARTERGGLLVMGTPPRWPLVLGAAGVGWELWHPWIGAGDGIRLDDAFLVLVLCLSTALALHAVAHVGMVQRGWAGYVFSGPLRWWTGASELDVVEGSGGRLRVHLESRGWLRLRATGTLTQLAPARQRAEMASRVTLDVVVRAPQRAHLSTWAAGMFAIALCTCAASTGVAERIDLASGRSFLFVLGVCLLLSPLAVSNLARRMARNAATQPDGSSIWVLAGATPWKATAVGAALVASGWLASRLALGAAPWGHAPLVATGAAMSWWAFASYHAARRVAVLAATEEGTWILHICGHPPRPVRAEEVTVDDAAARVRFADETAWWVSLDGVERLIREVPAARQADAPRAARDSERSGPTVLVDHRRRRRSH